ncbi:MAG: PaaI family thioesterase [Chloroflexi bacterium]|nr:PaaI family thioesterase [Chloroflexota bacterium]
MAGPKDELRDVIDQLSEDQAQTALRWLGVLARKDPGEAGPQSVGTLGDALGMETVAREPGRSRMRMEVDPVWHNPNGVLHGGVIYTMVDYSMGSAVQPDLPEGEYCATIEAKINYLSAVREGTLTVDTEVVKQGRNIAFTESKVTDEQGKLVATGSGTIFIIRASQ